MKQLIHFLFTMFLTGICIASPIKKSFNIDSKPIPFFILPEIPVTVSANCVKNGKLKKCQASLALAKANLRLLSENTRGGNPGARLCSEHLGGYVVWSVDAVGNEKTFCKFGDQSIVANYSLFVHGSKNKLKK